MIDTLRRYGSMLAVVVLVCISTAWADPGPEATQDPAYRIAFTFKPGDVSYWIVENEFDDSGAILSQAFPLSYGTTLRERRTIIQRVLAPTTRPTVKDKTKDWPNLVWEHDRYEVRERPPMSREDVFFDSHRHLYPPPSQRELGTIPGASVGFRMDPRTGKVAHVRIQPTRVQGPTTRKKLSSTGEKCRLNKENVQRLLRDIGEYYFPSAPQHVGDSWTITHREPIKGEQKLVTNLMCTLRSVREEDGRQIATIDLLGDVRLEGGKKKATTSAPTSGPAASQPGKDPKPATSKRPSDTKPAEAKEKAGQPRAVDPKAKPDSSPTATPKASGDDKKAQASVMHRTMTAGPGVFASAHAWTQRAPKPTAKKPSTTRPTTQPKNGKGVMRPGSSKRPRYTRQAKRPKRTTKSKRPRSTVGRSKPNFTLKSAVCSGSVQFDLTNGKLIELYLRRETNLAATLKSEKASMGPTTIKQGAIQVLRVRVLDEPPRKPVIVGGKTPPAIPAQDKVTKPTTKKPSAKPATGTRGKGAKKDSDASVKPRRPRAKTHPNPRDRQAPEPSGSTQPAGKETGTKARDANN